VRAEIGGVTGGHWHGWSPECDLGVHGMLMSVKQRQHPCGDGHEHSEHRRRHWVAAVQQNHSPVVVQSCGQPPACEHGLQGIVEHCTNGEPHGLHGPPPQPTQWTTEPSDTFARERTRPAPSELMPRNLKSCRREDFRASAREAAPARASLIE
jgi:hypothetical protein